MRIVCLLEYLVKHIGQIMEYKQIYEAVWKEPYACEKNNIMTHISHLRAKIESDPTHPRYIENIRGVGYRFKKFINFSMCSYNFNVAVRLSINLQYQGNQVVIFYGSNSWSYTRLGRIDDLTGWKTALGDGDITVTFALEEV